MFKIGREDPVASMDTSGKIIWYTQITESVTQITESYTQVTESYTHNHAPYTQITESYTQTLNRTPK